MGIEEYLVASTVNIAIGQRLVRDIGTEIAIGAGKTTRARTLVAGASLAISGPAAEMPFGAGAQPFFSVSISEIGRA